MARPPEPHIELTPLSGDARPLEDWLTTFPMAAVILDPYTYESSWILDTAARVMTGFRGADVRPTWICTTDVEGMASFLGQLTDEFLALADPDRELVESLGVEILPAFVLIKQDGSAEHSAQGWDPQAWSDVADEIAAITKWSRPPIPAPGDPIAYAGTPASGVA